MTNYNALLNLFHTGNLRLKSTSGTATLREKLGFTHSEFDLTISKNDVIYAVTYICGYL